MSSSMLKSFSQPAWHHSPRPPYPSQDGGEDMRRTASHPAVYDANLHAPGQPAMAAPQFALEQPFHPYPLQLPARPISYGYGEAEAHQRFFADYLSPTWSPTGYDIASCMAPPMSRGGSTQSSFSTNTSCSLDQPDPAIQTYLPGGQDVPCEAFVTVQQASDAELHILTSPQAMSDNWDRFDFIPTVSPKYPSIDTSELGSMSLSARHPALPRSDRSIKRHSQGSTANAATSPRSRKANHPSQSSARPNRGAVSKRRPSQSHQASHQPNMKKPVSPISSSTTAAAAATTATNSNTAAGRKVALIPKRPSPVKRETRQKLMCTECNEHPKGFRGQHELDRHRNRKHTPSRIMWICVDGSETSPEGSSGPNMLTLPLNKCKHCIEQKRYGAYYNAAAHLRRTHFFPCRRGRRPKAESISNRPAKRGGYGGGDDPPMDELKRYWLKVVYEDEYGNLIPGEPDDFHLPLNDGEEDVDAVALGGRRRLHDDDDDDEDNDDEDENDDADDLLDDEERAAATAAATVNVAMQEQWQAGAQHHYADPQAWQLGYQPDLGPAGNQYMDSSFDAIMIQGVGAATGADGYDAPYFFQT